MDNKAQQLPSLDKKRVSVNRLKELESLLGFASNPDWIDWDTAEIVGEGGDKLLSALQDYRAAFGKVKRAWREVYGEEIK